MGNFMIPVCCICGEKAPKWHDEDWEARGGLQDFCPKHAAENPELTEYIIPHMDPELSQHNEKAQTRAD